jgi:hypothetical protein
MDKVVGAGEKDSSVFAGKPFEGPCSAEERQKEFRICGPKRTVLLMALVNGDNGVGQPGVGE